jgi:hypothetical protein
MGNDKNLNYAIAGIKVGIIAMIINFIVEAISLFLPNTTIPPFTIGIFYFDIALILIIFLLKIEII